MVWLFNVAAAALAPRNGLVSIALLLLLRTRPLRADSVLVETASGTFRGRRSTISSTNFHVEEFIGIPYATVGERFSRATLVTEYGDPATTVVDATRPSPPNCYQSVDDPLRKEFLQVLSFFPQSEDCLTLNVYRPALQNDTTTSTTQDSLLLPIMVWIHGGGFVLGSGTLPPFDGRLLASEQKIIVISMNYRLGLFGFLMDEGGEMHGIHDQILSLQWIQNFARAFGGDPNSVTVAGQSAGSIATCVLAASPLAKGLFHRAIMQSGSCTSYLTGVVDSHENDEAMKNFRAKVLNATGAPSVDELKNATRYPAASITGYATSFTDPVSYLTVDGLVLPKSAREVFDNQENHVTEFLVGSTSYDDYFTSTVNISYVLENVITIENQTEWLTTYFQDYVKSPPRNENELRLWIDAAFDAYSADFYFGNPYLAALQLYGDSLFRCSMSEFAAATAAANSVVYLYNYAYLSSVELLRGTGVLEALNLTDDPGFASHGSEASVLFGSFVGSTGPLGAATPPNDVAIGQEMRARWASYVKHGNPSSPGDSIWEPVVPSSVGVPTFAFGPGGGRMDNDLALKVEQCSILAGRLSSDPNSAGPNGKKERSSKKKQKPKLSAERKKNKSRHKGSKVNKISSSRR